MNNKALTLSIVIPAFNEERYLPACLEAIAKQTQMPAEVIVVDNNSSDRTAAVARKYPFVRVISERHQGKAYARDAGFNASKSDILGRIDADTILPIDWAEKVLKKSADLNPDTAATGPCKFNILSGSYFWFYLHRMVYFWPSYLLLGHHTLFGSNMFLPRSLWQNVKSSTCSRNDIHEDMDLAIHIVRHGGKVRFIPDLKATISARRFSHPLHYPLMWLKTKFTHRRLPRSG